MDCQPLPFPQGVRHFAAWLLACCLAGGELRSEVPALLASAEAAEKRGDYRRAREAYLAANRLVPDQPETLWRLARACSQAAAFTESKSERRTLGTEALEAARRAANLAPDNPKARLSLSIALGRVASFESPRRQVEMSREIREEAEAAARLDPTEALAWHVLGRWHFEIANLSPLLKAFAQTLFGKFPDASNEQAAECFRKAIASGASGPMNHIEYGRALAKLGRKTEAAAEIRKGLALPSQAPDDKEAKARGRAALEMLAKDLAVKN